MAPSPEHDNEPKEPDKNENKTTETTLRTNSDILEDHLSASNRDLDLQDSNVSTLDDIQLRALLDEAINYKTPRDREGKSQIFKTLLQEAEEDERNARAASASGPQLARYYNTTARQKRGQKRGEAAAGASGASSVAVDNTRGGSLQDLVQGGLYEVEKERTGRRSGASKRRHHHQHSISGPRVSVSARQREGGSLPSNVNAGVFHPSDLRLFTDQKPSKTNSTQSTTTSDNNKVESCIEGTVLLAEGPLNGPQNPVKPEYTVIDLENAVDSSENNNTMKDISLGGSKISGPVSGAQVDVSVASEETKGLLLPSMIHTGWNSTENNPGLPKYRCHTSEPTSGSLGHQEVEKDEPVAETAPTGKSSKHQTSSTFDGVSRHQYFNPLEEALHNNPRIPRVRYTSRATLEVDGATTVDKPLNFSQFESSGPPSQGAGSLQLETEYNSVRCIVEGTNTTSETACGGGNPGARAAGQSTGSTPTQYRLLSVTNPKIMHGVDRFPHHAEKKGVDENGNSVTTTTDNNKKKKKCKNDRNVKVSVSSEKIPGHRADIIGDLDLLVKYIEDDTNSTKTKHNHHKPSIGEKTKPISIENKKRRIKTKSESNTNNATVKKSNSLEEISKTKLEDLVLEDSKRRIKKQSVSEDGYQTEDFPKLGEDLTVGTLVITPETDFHVVTKKKKSKKRSTTKQSSTTYYHYHRIDSSSQEASRGPTESHSSRVEPQRRKSACSVPPSEKSGDSSDVDSVHSLPVATVHRGEDGSPNGAQGAHHISSYADIARTNGGTSSASSNCSSQGMSNQGGVWKTSPQLSTSLSPTAPQTIVVNPAPPDLLSEHFPVLCSEKEGICGALGAALDTITPVETSPIRLETDFPTLGGENSEKLKTKFKENMSQISDIPMNDNPFPVSANTISVPQIVGAQASPPKTQRQTQTDSNFKICETPVENRHVHPKKYRVVSRPAVIILDEQNGDADIKPEGPIQVAGLTFGFELNEQLLNDSDYESVEEKATKGSSSIAEAFSARYVAPKIEGPYAMSYNYDKIVSFVGLAWEDIVHQNNGKVQYYNGQ